MLIVALLHAAVESAVIAGVRGFRPHIKVHAVVDQDPCVRRRMIALSPIKPNYLRIAAKSSCNRARFEFSSVEDSL
jgi:hypothetical protein